MHIHTRVPFLPSFTQADVADEVRRLRLQRGHRHRSGSAVLGGKRVALRPRLERTLQHQHRESQLVDGVGLSDEPAPL